MASPHVAGAAALYLSQNPEATPLEIGKHLIAQSTPQVIDMNCGIQTNCLKTPNLLLYASCDS